MGLLDVGLIHASNFFKPKKIKLSTASVLLYADFSSSFFILEVDASHGGLGTVPSHEADCIHKSGLRTTETNRDCYCLLSLKLDLTKILREYLLGDKGVVFTDKNPLMHQQHWVRQSNNGLANLTLCRNVSIPPVDHAPWLLGQRGSLWSNDYNV